MHDLPGPVGDLPMSFVLIDPLTVGEWSPDACMIRLPRGWVADFDPSVDDIVISLKFRRARLPVGWSVLGGEGPIAPPTAPPDVSPEMPSDVPLPVLPPDMPSPLPTVPTENL